MARPGQTPQSHSSGLEIWSSFPSYPRIFAACRSLRALVLSRPTEMDIVANDPHFVMTVVDSYPADWQRGVLTGHDYWERVDAFIAKQLSGEINRASRDEPQILPWYLISAHISGGTFFLE